MKILIYGTSSMSLSYSFIAPLRIARTCFRHGDQVRMLEWINPAIPETSLKEGHKPEKWGDVYSYPLEKMIPMFIDMLEDWQPDVIYLMGHGGLETITKLCKKYSVPIILHIGDPFYAEYASDNLLDLYIQCDAITFNEGQAWNYIKLKRPGSVNKCYLLNHAIDPELAPTWEEVQKIEKKYICSCVGGDDRIRRRELLLYFYQWTNSLSNQKFAVGGSLDKGVVQSYTRNELVSHIIEGNQSWNHTELTENEVERLKRTLFNIEKIPHDLEYPLGLSHKAVHQLYSQSFYGFTPFGKYLCEGGRVSEFNTMTFGTKMMEQLGCGCAVIANRIKDIEHIIKHGENGFILEKPEDGLKAFKLAVEKPEEVKQMGLNAYQFAHKYHSWDNRYKEVIEPIFQKLGIKK